jgi:hypothetical protein
MSQSTPKISSTRSWSAAHNPAPQQSASTSTDVTAAAAAAAVSQSPPPPTTAVQVIQNTEAWCRSKHSYNSSYYHHHHHPYDYLTTIILPWCILLGVCVVIWYIWTQRQYQRIQQTTFQVLQRTMLAMKQDVHAYRNDTSTIRVLAIHSKKLQTLEFAIANAAINSFEYYQLVDNTDDGDDDEGNTTITGQLLFCNSQALVMGILLSFRQGKGHLLPLNAYLQSPTNDGKTAFRNAVLDQIATLIGHPPRCQWEDGKLILYYS